MELAPFSADPGQLRGAAAVSWLIAPYTLKQPLQTERFRYAIACCCLQRPAPIRRARQLLGGDTADVR